jgi:hypothetical protein
MGKCPPPSSQIVSCKARDGPNSIYSRIAAGAILQRGPGSLRLLYRSQNLLPNKSLAHDVDASIVLQSPTQLLSKFTPSLNTFYEPTRLTALYLACRLAMSLVQQHLSNPPQQTSLVPPQENARRDTSAISRQKCPRYRSLTQVPAESTERSSQCNPSAYYPSFFPNMEQTICTICKTFQAESY